MSRKSFGILFSGLLVIALAATVLQRLKTSQRLGQPGLKVTQLAGSGKLRIDLPEALAGYASTLEEPTEIEVKSLPADTTFARRLFQGPDGFRNQLSVVMMGTDRTSIHKPEYCLESQGWHIVERQSATVHLDRPYPHDLPVRRFTSSALGKDANGNEMRWSALYVFWFVADGHVTSSHWERIKLMTWDLMTKGVLPRWAYVSCFAPCPPGREEETYRRIEAFLRLAVPEFQAPPGGAGAKRGQP